MESNEGKIDETVERKYHYKEERTEYINQNDAQKRRDEEKGEIYPQHNACDAKEDGQEAGVVEREILRVEGRRHIGFCSRREPGV